MFERVSKSALNPRLLCIKTKSIDYVSQLQVSTMSEFEPSTCECNPVRWDSAAQDSVQFNHK